MCNNVGKNTLVELLYIYNLKYFPVQYRKVFGSDGLFCTPFKSTSAPTIQQHILIVHESFSFGSVGVSNVNCKNARSNHLPNLKPTSFI